jgi:hypothetical protein
MSETIYYRSVNPELFVGQPPHIQTLRIGTITTVRVGHVVHTVQSIPVQGIPMQGIIVGQPIQRNTNPNILHLSFSQQFGGGWR